jgi:hypothetical protein
MMKKDNYIPLSDCTHRGIYRLGSRNLSLGVFNKPSNGFIGIREKFGDLYLFTEYHWDNGPPFGTACPYEFVGTLPDDIEVRETVDTFDSVTRRLVDFDRKPISEDDLKPKGWFFIDTGEYSREIRPCTATYKPLFDHLMNIQGVEHPNTSPEEECLD